MRPDPPAVRFDASGFDVVAELKPRSPLRGSLLAGGSRTVPERAAAYARGGACAVSVLTDPAAFGGSLTLLSAMARASGLPTMRKDFLVDPYQVVEARANGASGVLLIARLLDAGLLREMMAAAACARLFALVEVFGPDDLDRGVDAVAAARGAALLGVNARDLKTLAVDPSRHASLARLLPAGCRSVAESGIGTPADAARVARLGYAAALVGSSLMQAPDSAALLTAMIASGRKAAIHREVTR